MDLPGIQASGNKDLIFIKGFAPADSAETTLRTGDMLQARVVAQSRDSVILRVGNARITASAEMALAPGRVVSLLVAEIGAERIVFKLIEPKGTLRGPRKYDSTDLLERFAKAVGLPKRDIQVLAGLLDKSSVDMADELAQLLRLLDETDKGGTETALRQSLRDAIKQIVVGDGPAEDIELKLRALIKALSHESLLLSSLERGEAAPADLKALLLELRSTGLTEKSQLVQAIEKLIHILNAVQLINHPLEQPAPGWLYIPLPMLFGDDKVTAHINIKVGEREERGVVGTPGSAVIEMLLNMPMLGLTSARIELVESDVRLDIHIENTDAVETARSQLYLLTDALSDIGYRVVSVEVDAAPGSGFRNRSLLEAKLGIPTSGIDIQA